MDENKNLNPELEEETVVATEENIAEATETEKAPSEKRSKKAKKAKIKKEKPIKNQALFKRGSYSLALTAAVVAGAIILNILVGALADRFVLEFDMSSDKSSSFNEENIDYIKSIDQKIDITVCADEETYADYMSYYSQQYEVNDSNATPYYEQTVKLINRYADYNNKITVNFVDTQGAEFSKIASEYSNEKLTYGDIIVSTEKDGTKKYKKVGFTDIYSLSQDNTYASYGYTTYTVGSNKVETAVTGAIDYVTKGDIKKVGIITGHSANDYTSVYQELLKSNNYEIEIISDKLITELSDELDAIVIAAPTTDFIGSELDAMSKFLENDGKLSKGLLFFADVNSPYLTNFYEFLNDWGIAVDEGILYETNASNHLTDDPLTMGLYSSGLDNITDGMQLFITGGNVPIKAAFDTDGGMTTTSLVKTLDSVIAAPKGTKAGWTGAEDYEADTYEGVLQTRLYDYDDDNNVIESYVMAFSSIGFIYSDYIEEASVSNKNIALSVTERATGADKSDIQFVSKTITNESFSSSVTQTSTNIIRIIFMFLLPIICIVAGIYIYIKRRNA